jgi:hypothetical protein
VNSLDGGGYHRSQAPDLILGLSNFNILKTKRILEVAKILPAVNQVEIHP